MFLARTVKLCSVGPLKLGVAQLDLFMFLRQSYLRIQQNALSPLKAHCYFHQILWTQPNKDPMSSPDTKVEKEIPPSNARRFSVTFQKTWVQRKLHLRPSQQTCPTQV